MRAVSKNGDMSPAVPFSWSPIGWFQIGYASEFPVGTTRPLRYFGEDLVVYRGDLHVLSAHCPHLGAHIGHGGLVVGDCVVCPYHGWTWSAEGVNVEIPYQDKPNKSKRLQAWPVAEQYGSVFVWNDPDGGSPTWEMPDIFKSFPQFETNPDSYYEPFVMTTGPEPVHPQLVAENGPDSVHFQYVHHATVTPMALDWNPDGPIWKFVTGWPDARSIDPSAMALRIHSWLFGLGGAISAFEGQSRHRLTFTVTPIEEGKSDLRYTIWWPRTHGDISPIAPPETLERMKKEYLGTMEEDLEIWRYQRYIANPALAKQDAKPYKALRSWSKQFYAVTA
jgi:3-ketosteroid 9alpha-monooxygenase subunit A